MFTDRVYIESIFYSEGSVMVSISYVPFIEDHYVTSVYICKLGIYLLWTYSMFP